MKLPCLLLAGSCETTSVDSFAYMWDIPENCAIAKNLTQAAKMLHYPLTTHQKEDKFFFLSEFNKTNEEMNIKTRVFPESCDL